MKNRLREIREERRLTLKDVEKLLNKEWSFQTIGNFETGKSEPSERLVRRLAEVLKVRVEEIAPEMGGLMMESPTPYMTGDVRPEFGVHYRAPRRVPVVGFVAGADFLCNRKFDYSDMANQIEDEIETTSKDPNALGLIVEGDSMYPEIKAGDKIVVAPNAEPRNDDVVVARLAEEGSAIIKRFHRSGPEGRTIRLESTNKHYADIVKDITEFRFIYPVVKIERTRR